MKIVILSLIILLYTNLLNAQVFLPKEETKTSDTTLSLYQYHSQPKETYAHILIQNQNDYWKWRSSTDRYFTNGIYIEYANSKIFESGKKNLLMNLFPQSKSIDNANLFSFGLEQDMYTPQDIAAENVQSNDRPYAGLLYINAKNISTSYLKQTRISTTYTIGVIGPKSYSEQVQKLVHKWLGYTEPRGWPHQIKGDLATNLNIRYERMAFQPAANIDFIGYLEINGFSTISNNLSLGAISRIGQFRNYFSPPVSKKTYVTKLTKAGKKQTTTIKRSLQIYGYIKSSITSVLDNSLLEGGVINRTSEYTINADEISRFYFNNEFGLNLNFNGWEIKFSQLVRTPEFKGANISYWGKLQFTIPL